MTQETISEFILSDIIHETPNYIVAVVLSEETGELLYGVINKKWDVVESQLPNLAASIATAKYYERMLTEVLASEVPTSNGPSGFPLSDRMQ